MTKTAIPLVLALATSSLGGCASEAPPDSDAVYSITVPSFTINPGEEKFYCYFTTLPVAADTGVKRYDSTMTPGSHHMILFYMQQATQPDGTLAECNSFGGSSATSAPIFAYASQEPKGTQAMPDGVGIALKANQPVMVNMHYVNAGDQPITASVKIDIHTYAPEVTFTPAHVFFTFNTGIDVPPHSTGSAEGSCAVPPDANFIIMTTHSHQFTTDAWVMDGSDMVVETTDWKHAAVEQWLTAPYHRFASGQLTYHCDYSNPGNTAVTVGESALTSEMCIAVGYFFPADHDVYCLDSTVLTP